GAELGLVGFTGEASQGLDARARRERRGGLVEPEVAIAADPQELQVDSAGSTDVALIPFARASEVAASGRPKVGPPAVDVHAAEKMRVHERVERGRMRRVQADVFVEVERGHPG